jgi:hypothetical protein
VRLRAWVSLPWLALQAQPEGLQQKIGGLEQKVQSIFRQNRSRTPVLRELLSLDPKNLNARQTYALLFLTVDTPEAPHTCCHRAETDLSRIQALLEWRKAPANGHRLSRSGACQSGDKKIRVDAGLELIELYSAVSELDKVRQPRSSCRNRAQNHESCSSPTIFRGGSWIRFW